MYRRAVPIMLVLILSACGSSQSSSTAPAEDGRSAESERAISPPARWYTTAHVNYGAGVFRDNCAQCHGIDGEGAPGWRQVGPDGKFLPPPLNGTGHAWHHPLRMLFHVIKNGSPGGQGNMPPWKDKLSDEEILAVVAWFQSRWPDEVYAAWWRRDQQVSKTSGS